MSELDNLIEGFSTLKNLGASGVIAEHDEIIVVGSRHDIPFETRQKLFSLGFETREDHKWAVSV